MTSSRTETAFESAIEEHLLAYGYVAVPPTAYDRDLALFPSEAVTFIRKTQADTWAKLETILGDDTERQVVADLAKWLDAHGALATLRHGFKCYGRTLRLAHFRPAHGLNPDLKTAYDANRVGITRQLHHSARRPNRSLDVVLSVNGLPVVTVELKNPFTGQTAEDAKVQYRTQRDPRERLFEFKRRTLAHFAVDPDTVWMTTRLAKDATHFLPFNRGTPDGGAGNPADPERSYRTGYLWEAHPDDLGSGALSRGGLLDLLARFLHLQTEQKRDDEGRRYTKETLIFPRYHQLRAVRKLEAMARSEGPGHNYLVEHSAGSGKSNTIGWLAHRLVSLHDDRDDRVFSSVVVVTDRTVLDRQLQDTIYQFEHRQGVVQKIDKDSRQLAVALQGGIPIIITTLQKFPFVTKRLAQMAEEAGHAGGNGASHTLSTRNVAVIIDEAHSSQGGDAATELKGVLGGEALRERAAAAAAEEDGADPETLFVEMAKRARQPNLSFFAFTATPKHVTQRFFGRGGKPTDKYSMRQAIDEGFIMDILSNYVTYETYYKLLKASADDPRVERKKAARALARYMRLHPHNIAQKTAVMVEHFVSVTRHKIGGKAKAMVVTGSRLEAVRYKQAFDRYIADKGYPIRTLVAFSGVVEDDKVEDKTYTEMGMNGGIKEKELPDKFAGPGYQVLLVAEKYQTGFDQPLLHTMYVDRRLAGLQAVQTLSRLNRTHPLKEDTFVLDFVNSREEIRAAFSDYYEGASMGEEVEPGRMYELKAELDRSGIYLAEEVDRFAALFYRPARKQSAADHKALNATLDPAVDRFRAFLDSSPDEAELWRRKATAFSNVYRHLSQVIPYQDSDLEKLYSFLRHLATKLPRRASGPSYQFDEEVRLQYYRLQKISEGAISLSEEDGRPLDGPTEVGSGVVREQPVALSQLVDLINERFGTDFTSNDQLFFDQVLGTVVEDESLGRAAVSNPEDRFALVVDGAVDAFFFERMDQNGDLVARYVNDADFRKAVVSWITAEAYKHFNDDGKS